MYLNTREAVFLLILFLFLTQIIVTWVALRYFLKPSYNRQDNIMATLNLILNLLTGMAKESDLVKYLVAEKQAKNGQPAAQPHAVTAPLPTVPPGNIIHPPENGQS